LIISMAPKGHFYSNIISSSHKPNPLFILTEASIFKKVNE
jgi:hypothetical protein